MSGLKDANCIAMVFDKNPFTWQCQREDQKAEGFQISHFYGSFSNHTMAVKGLTELCVGWLTAWDLWGQFRYWDRCAETRSAPSVAEPFTAVWRKGAGRRGLECVFFPVAFRSSFLLPSVLHLHSFWGKNYGSKQKSFKQTNKQTTTKQNKQKNIK